MATKSVSAESFTALATVNFLAPEVTIAAFWEAVANRHVRGCAFDPYQAQKKFQGVLWPSLAVSDLTKGP